MSGYRTSGWACCQLAAKLVSPAANPVQDHWGTGWTTGPASLAWARCWPAGNCAQHSWHFLPAGRPNTRRAQAHEHHNTGSADTDTIWCRGPGLALGSSKAVICDRAGRNPEFTEHFHKLFDTGGDTCPLPAATPLALECRS